MDLQLCFTEFDCVWMQTKSVAKGAGLLAYPNIILSDQIDVHGVLDGVLDGKEMKTIDLLSKLCCFQ